MVYKTACNEDWIKEEQQFSVCHANNSLEKLQKQELPGKG
jgi:hypothetical protein